MKYPDKWDISVDGRFIMRVAKNLTELIGKTPMLALERLYPGSKAKVYVKLELFNPMSIKDRPVLHMIREAMAKGRINPGIEVVEASSGNTAIALATLGAIMDFPVRVFISEEVTIERRRILASFGAKIVLTPAVEHTRGARNRAIAYCEANPDTAFFLNQHGNPDNPRAHELTTGPEMWKQLDGNIDAVVIALGTCGTFDGVARFLKSKNPAIQAIGVEPAGSPLYSGGKQGKHKIDGMGPGLVSDIFKQAPFKPDEILKIEDDDAFEWTRRVAQKEGLFVGLTSGSLAWAAHQLASRKEYEYKTIVTFFYDTGERYLSVPDLFPEGDVTTVS
jgi:cysteine synthase A